jgi:splicing factor U2AF 65 kDa subunit
MEQKVRLISLNYYYLDGHFPAPTVGLSPVLGVYINHDKCFAFVELNSVELTTACCELDGIEFKGKAGTVIIRVRRPNDFRAELLPPATRPIPKLNINGISVVGTTVADGPNKIYVGGIPYNVGEEQVRELLEAFGTLKSFHLVKDLVTGFTKGYGFCEYADPAMTIVACTGLNGLEIGDKVLTVRLNNAPFVGGDMPTLTQGKEATRVRAYS